MMALKGVRALSGHWPCRAMLEQGCIDDLQNLVEPAGDEALRRKPILNIGVTILWLVHQQRNPAQRSMASISFRLQLRTFIHLNG